MKRICISVLALLFVLAVLASAGCGDDDSSVPGDGQEQAATLVFSDPELQFQLTRALGDTAYGGADIGECLSTAGRIDEGDVNSWYTEWYETAERILSLAEASLAAGHEVSAREAYLRATTYYAMAEFYLHGDPSDPRIRESSARSRDSFARAAQLFSPPIEPVSIPYEGITLPGYFYRVDDSGAPRPTIIIQTGFDGTQEELYNQGAIAAVRRGYNCLTFEGPGQGEVIREQGLPFRYDWEKVITPVVDYVMSRPEVDQGKVALFGISMGGYLAPRGAAFEPRLAALIADGGVFEPWYPACTSIAPHYPPSGGTAEGLVASIRDDPDDFDQAIEEVMGESIQLNWFIGNGMFTFGVDKPSAFLLAFSQYSMAGVADRISCPTLVIDSDNDTSMKGEPQRLYDALTCPKDFILFTTEEGAGLHCQMGAMLLAHQRIFDWLDETLSPRGMQ
ncbi:MAG: alpha/beta fold hydrolase [Actinobacteria bacterium]|jgi:pimeloyl-ACP methyl ester carboxylesterase|nr:MAG: alpha/beta fold hydrolase [Actinomycetota bacterium]